jgi:Penicillin-Binding Protein C-terminus Family.
LPLAARAQASVGARIVSPSEGSIIALDPDIPREHQRLPLVSGEPTTASCWATESTTLGCAERLFWSPEPGEYQLRLLDHDGRERDRVRILVRGRVEVQGR